MGELHLFGVGTEYHSRAQEVLAVWQGAAKHGSLTAEQLADALVQGTMKDFFEQTCRELAQTRSHMQSRASAVSGGGRRSCADMAQVVDNPPACKQS